MRQAQDSAPDDPFSQGLRETYNTLETERRTTLAAIDDLDAAERAEPTRPAAEDVDLLNALPYLTLNLAQAPQQLLRGLFEITSLTIRLHADSDDATITIRLPATELPVIAEAAERITNTMNTAQETPAQPAGTSCADAVRAPGAIRTHTGRVLNPIRNMALTSTNASARVCGGGHGVRGARSVAFWRHADVGSRTTPASCQ
ncbi:hypothetical protein [Actinophytocola sp.]|uniref:hypothetical protein n=1 Tax=Actinophytocola sp. TaxID=1872138 RepID=UPI002D5819A3|nr:hypothetical protein [Actinophytocola sp.]HYQ66179.1 hypothetical protein [Actinophytocola sp.]